MPTIPSAPRKPFAFNVVRHGFTDRDGDIERWVDRARALVATDMAFLAGNVSIATASTHRNTAPRQARALVAELWGLVASIGADLRSGAQSQARSEQIVYPLVSDLQQIQARGTARA